MTSKRKALIFDASTIVVLFELGCLNLIKDLRKFFKIIIPRQVYSELVRGPYRIPLDPSLIWEMKLVSIPPEIDVSIMNLGEGEKATIKIAYILKKQGVSTIVVTDDRQARRRCEEIGLNVKGTLGLMKLAVKHKILDKNKAIKLIRRV